MSDLRLRTLRAFGRAPSLRTAARKHAVPAVEPVEKPREAAKPKGHSVVDSAIYVDGRRVASPRRCRDLRACASTPRAWPGSACTGRRSRSSQSLAPEFQLHELPSRTRSRPISGRSSSGTSDTLFVVLRAARYRGRDRGGRVRRGPRVRRPRLRRHRPARRSAGPGRRTPPARKRARAAAAAGPRPCSTRSSTRSSTATHPVVAGVAERHRRDRDRGVPRRPQGVPAHLRAVPGGDRVPARHPARWSACSTALRAGFDKYGVDEELQRSPARRRGPRDPGRWSASTVSASCSRDMLTVNATLVAQQQNEEMRSLAMPATRRTRRSRRSPPGRPSCSLRP